MIELGAVLIFFLFVLIFSDFFVKKMCYLRNGSFPTAEALTRGICASTRAVTQLCLPPTVFGLLSAVTSSGLSSCQVLLPEIKAAFKRQTWSCRKSSA